MAYNPTGELRQAAARPVPYTTAPGDGPPPPYRYGGYGGYGGAADGAAAPFLREFFRTFLRHIWLFILFVILGVAAAGVVALRQEETFSAHAVVLLEPPSEQFVEVVSPLGGGSLDNLMLQTQIQVVQSYDNLGAVVDELNLTNDPRFMGAANGAPGTDGNAGAADESLLDQAASWLKGWVKRVETLWAGDGAPAVAADTDRDSLSRRDRAVAKLANQLDVKQGGQSRTIRIGFTSEHRALAAAVPNTLANAYVESLRERASTRTSEASEWLDDRVEEVRAELEGYEQQIAALRNEVGAVGPGQSVTEREDYSLLTQRLIAAQSELADARARLQSAGELRAGGGAGLQGFSDVLTSPIIAQLKEQEAELRRERATLAAEFGPRHPQIVRNRTELAELEEKIGEEAERIFNSLRTTVASLENQVATFERRLTEIKNVAEENRAVGIELAELESKAQATRDLYYDLKRRSAEAYGGLGLVRAGATILSPAQPPTSPSSPPPVLFLLAGLAVGITSGFAAIFVREQLDSTVRRSEDLQNLLGCPCIAIVPQLSQRERIDLVDAGGYQHSWRQTRFLESVRVIASHVHLIIKDNDHARDGGGPADKVGQTLLFTSAVPSEGKTTLSAASALAMARLGMRVVLLDTDLRCPRIAEHLQLDGKSGLLEVLTEGPTRYREFIQRIASGQVHVLPCSSPVSSPNEVLASAQFDELISILRRDYDLVIFDAPPLLGLAEMSYLLRRADDILFVSRWGFAPRDTLLQAKGLVEIHGRNLSACILSQIPVKRYRYYGEGDYGPMIKEYKKYFRD